MAKTTKTTTEFVCTECGASSPRWLGRCPSCGKFNTMAEEIVKPAEQTKGERKTVYDNRAKLLKDVGLIKSFAVSAVVCPSGMVSVYRVPGDGSMAVA